MNKKWTLFDYINTIIMVLILIITVYPFIYVVAVSFSDSVYILQNKVKFFPRGFNVKAYKMIFESPKIPRAYLNTIMYTVVGTSINVFLTAITAYPLARKDLFGKKVWMTLIIITMFFNGGMIPNYLVVQKLKLLDTIWALVIPNAIWTYELLVTKSFYESLPHSLYESAVIDGASEARIMFQIYMPLSKACLASITLFYVMGHWNSYFLPMIYLNDMERYPLQVVLREMLILDTAKRSEALGEYSSLTPQALKNATIFVSILPILALYPYIQKYFVKGVMLGSVKG
ncbi:MAG: carbohydrate ABC transporter permease [Xylanivirga thermophila]|uniref:carbohydrate ABC transporter permease n=1 Tax=Xylanivirga thermophila TaxID=2496273 RepID=UPI00101BB17E|nr:carbohydrate ABC transporter permease [Xylanivirga thermophila]